MLKIWELIFKKNKVKREPSHFLDIGFHGDKYLLSLIDRLIRDCDYFIETGANVGSTLAFVARTFQHVKCLSCEPNKSAFDAAVKNTSKYPNVTIFNKTSQEFIDIIKHQKRDLFDKKILFWLDAHGYGFEWPLKKEIEFITVNFKNPYILIDDFMVPGFDCFKYDRYKEQVCSFDFIKNAINKEFEFSLYYPSYTDRTSTIHPLTGWGLMVGGNKIQIPSTLAGKITKAIK